LLLDGGLILTLAAASAASFVTADLSKQLVHVSSALVSNAKQAMTLNIILKFIIFILKFFLN
jgi:hypothetical protein